MTFQTFTGEILSENWKTVEKQDEKQNSWYIYYSGNVCKINSKSKNVSKKVVTQTKLFNWDFFFCVENKHAQLVHITTQG